VDPAVLDVSLLETTVQLAADGGYARQEPLIFYVGAPVLVHELTTFTDASGNGSIEAGEDVTLELTLENRGLGRSSAVTATLAGSDPAIQIVDGTCNYGDLEAAGSGVGDGFVVRYSDGNESHPLVFTVSDHRGVVLEKTLELVPPGIPGDLTVLGDSDRITLRWGAVSSSDLRGYHVYRSASAAGPFARVTDRVTDRIAYFGDEQLPALNRFYYYVTAVDSSGNESAASGIGEGTTSLPMAEGYPLGVGASSNVSPTIGFFDGDKLPEVVTGGSEVHIFTADGNEYMDGDQDARTFGVFSNTGVGPFWSPPAVADMDLDGRAEIVTVGYGNGWLYVWDRTGEVKPGWPQDINLSGGSNPACIGAAALGDVDGDLDLELFINVGAHTFGFHHDGTEVVDGDGNPGTNGIFLTMGTAFNFSTPAIADVDNDGQLEIIVGSRDGKLYVKESDGSDLPGFPFVTGGEITNSPAVADLDKDGLNEIIFASGDFTVHALNRNLQEPPGWPTAANMNRDLDGSPALADIDGDGYLDVILCAGNGTVYLWHGQNGQLFPGWGFVLYDANGVKVGLSSSPAVGNLDADPELEICFGDTDGRLYAFNEDASLVGGFPIDVQNSIDSGPLLWDINLDGYTEVVVHSFDENVYVWKSPGVFDPDNQPWPMFHRNAKRNGDASSPIFEPLAAPAEDGPGPRLLLHPALPNPFASRTTIGYSVPGNGAVSVELAVYDVRGRLVRTLHRGLQDPGEHQAVWDGRSDDGRRTGGGVYFYRLRTPEGATTRKLVRVP
jgi:hypothetical protein